MGFCSVNLFISKMKKLYGIDMEQTQYSKLLKDIPAPDIAIAQFCTKLVQNFFCLCKKIKQKM